MWNPYVVGLAPTFNIVEQLILFRPSSTMSWCGFIRYQELCEMIESYICKKFSPAMCFTNVCLVTTSHCILIKVVLVIKIYMIRTCIGYKVYFLRLRAIQHDSDQGWSSFSLHRQPMMDSPKHCLRLGFPGMTDQLPFPPKCRLL